MWKVDDRFRAEIEPGRRWIEVGVASCDSGNAASLSVRHHVRGREGGFDPLTRLASSLRSSLMRWWMSCATTCSTAEQPPSVHADKDAAELMRAEHPERGKRRRQSEQHPLLRSATPMAARVAGVFQLDEREIRRGSDGEA